MAKNIPQPYRAFTPQQEALITQQTEIIVKGNNYPPDGCGRRLLADDFRHDGRTTRQWTRRTMFYASPAGVGGISTR